MASFEVKFIYILLLNFLFFFSSKDSLKNLEICSLNLNKINAEDFSKFVTRLETVKLDFNFLTFEQIDTLFEKV